MVGQMGTHVRITSRTTNPVNLDLASWIGIADVRSEGRVHATVDGWISRAFDGADR